MKNVYKQMKRNGGFTLIELLVVVAIIGILSSVVLASLGGAREGARNSRRQQDLGQLQTAMELYANANGTYDLSVAGDSSTDLSALQDGGYIQTLPTDPSAPGSQPGDGYEVTSSSSGYCIGTGYYELGDDGELPDNHVGCGAGSGDGATYNIGG